MSESEAVFEALRLAGYLLALQAGIAARGEVPPPQAILALEQLDVPQLILFTEDSGSYEHKIATGKITLAEQGREAHSWAFSYDEDLGLSGKVLFLEIGLKEWGTISFAQRYAISEHGEFRLAGGVQLLGREYVPAPALEELESYPWKEILDEGAERHEEVGDLWRQWRSTEIDEDLGLLHCLDRYCFSSPQGWITRQTEDEKGLLFCRLLPWDLKGSEPVITVYQLSFPGKSTLAAAVEHLATPDPDGEMQVLETEIFELQPGLSVGRVLTALQKNEMMVEKNLVPTQGQDAYLGLWSVGEKRLWEENVRARDSLLHSIEIQDDETGGDGRSLGDRVKERFKRWFG